MPSSRAVLVVVVVVAVVVVVVMSVAVMLVFADHRRKAKWTSSEKHSACSVLRWPGLYTRKLKRDGAASTTDLYALKLL